MATSEPAACPLHDAGMLIFPISAAALALALPTAVADSAHNNRETKIEEAHDTPPENLPANTGKRGRASGVPKRAEKPDTRGAGASTRGESIDEAHRTSPENTPARNSGK